MNPGSACAKIQTETAARAEIRLQFVRPQQSKKKRLWPFFLLITAGLNVAFQIAWFWPLTSRNINADAVSYIGIARHITDGDFRASLHGYWSPLVSWCIAALWHLTHNLVLAGHLISIGSFLLCMPLLYLLTWKLWRSTLLAALAVLCFTLSRSLVKVSVSFIGADFLLSAAVLAYFLALLPCFEQPERPRRWLLLGAAHGVAFVAKAFAMPWLMLSTVSAAMLACKRNPRAVATSAMLGLILPCAVYAGWGALLRTKYGHFTAGYQSTWNLLDSSTKKSSGDGNLIFLRDTSRSIDSYMVVDSMYPGSQSWNAHIHLHPVLFSALSKERENLPEAVKQIIILLTPGGILALAWCFWWSTKNRHANAKLAWLLGINTLSLAFGYCMLVFDARYVLPLIAPAIALAVRFLIPERRSTQSSVTAFTPLVVYVGSTVFFLAYWASPFRTQRRDYQTSVYAMAADLRQIPSCNRLIVIGKGPFPEHGVGWEAGLYASSFAGCRVVAISEDLPSGKSVTTALRDVDKVAPDAIVLLGHPQMRDFAAFENNVGEHLSSYHSASLRDPEVGAIGELLWK